MLGPLLFNIFINDIFYFIEKSTLYNYADDNTLGYRHKNPEILKSVLEAESNILVQWFSINQMQANPEKFQAMAVGKSTYETIKTFNIGAASISCDAHVKLLGIDVDYMLNFDRQISNICKKAAIQLNVLLRLRKFLNQESRMAIYKTFIKSNFNYCPLVWHFCSKSNTNKLEKLQHRALRITYNDFTSSYNELLNKANMPSLHLNRVRSLAVEAFNVFTNNLLLIYII